MFGRINSETRAFEWAPVNFITPDGVTICNFHKNEFLLREYGFKTVVQEPEPGYDPDEIAVPHYTDEGDIIRVTWEVIREEV